MTGPVPPPASRPLSLSLSPSRTGMAGMSQRAPNKRTERDGGGGGGEEQKHCPQDGERSIVKKTDSLCGRTG